MQRIRFYLKKIDLRYVLPLVIISFITRMQYFFTIFQPGQGLERVTDTQWYLEHANSFIQNGKIEYDVNGVFYLGYYALLGLIMLVFKSYTINVIIQNVINSIAAVLVYKIGYELFNKRTGITAGILYAFTYPAVMWSNYLITDSLFLSLLLLNVFLLIRSYSTKAKYYKVFFVISSLYMIIFRPTGIITLTFIFLYIIINMNFANIKKAIFKNWVICLFIVICVASAFIIAFKSGIFKPLILSIYLSMYWVVTDIYALGRVFDIPTVYDYSYKVILDMKSSDYVLNFFLNNWINVLVLYLRKFVFFWAFRFANFSFYKVIFILSYAFSLVGMINVIKQKILKRTSLILLVILSINVFCIVFFIDSAYRYRTPALVFLNFIAAYGVDRVIFVVKNKYFQEKII